jgi:hypothetical protein
MRWTVALSLCTATSFGCDRAERPCNLAAVVGERSGAKARDCGTLALDAGVPAIEAAQQCVRDALATKMAFRVVIYQRGIDSTVATAFAWNGAGPIVMLAFDGSPYGGGGIDDDARIHAYTCETLTERPGCSVQQGELCLSCSAQSTSTLVCD